MPPPTDASGLALLAQRVRLLSEPQRQDALENFGGSRPDELTRYLERKGILTPWQSSKLLKGDPDGYFLGGYRLLYRIASGSFGRVFRADDPRSGTIVALKVLRRRWSEDKHKIELFEREGKVGLKLKHPNIVEILAVSRDAPTNQYFIVMEFVEGGTLRDFLTIRKKLPPADALRVIEEAASGLAHALQHGLTHRDIKPTNILMSSQGACKLVDFGLADITEGATGGGDEGDVEVDHSVDYAGLERVTGVKRGDPRSDIFFLGGVLFELLTGQKAMPSAKGLNNMQRQQRFNKIAPLPRNEFTAPPSLFGLVEKMMALDPAGRFQTPAALVEAVRRVRAEVSGGPGAMPSGPAGPRTLFLIEHKQRLQDALRETFKDMGYRVLISVDTQNALKRYKQQPFHALVIDAGTAGEEGLDVFEEIQKEAEGQGLTCASILILSEDQQEWLLRITDRPNVRVIVRPVTLKQLTSALDELDPAPESPPEEAE